MSPRPPPSPPAGKSLRKSLSHVGGTARFSGDESLRDLMARASNAAVDADGGEDGAFTSGAERALTHGFHPWPGRLHPQTARELIRAAPEGVIADPFMGAGTVPLEAMLEGRMAWGNDLNPIGSEVAWVRTRRFSAGALGALVARAKLIAKKADALVAGGAVVDPAFRDAVGKWFDPQALIEVWALAKCLREGDPSWQGSPGDPLTRVLKMALSSILVKASRQVSDSVTKLDRRDLEATPKGRVGHWFKKRTEELAGQLDEFAATVGRAVPEPQLVLGDARMPPEGRPAFAAIISSPPYPGVYDYLTHHALRCAVLGLPVGDATQHEIGSRRASERLGKQVAHARYVDDLGKVLASWSETLMPGGFLALIIGDGQSGTEVVRVLPLLDAAAKAAGLFVRATLSQARPTFTLAMGPRTPGAAEAPRPTKEPPRKEEHLVWLERAPA